MPTAGAPTRWSDLKKKLVELDRSALVALIKDLHDASKTNQAFLASRLASPLEAEGALESYRERVVKAFYPGRGIPTQLPRLSVGRTVLREYKRARPDDLYGLADLMLTYVETGTRFTNEFGDIDDAFYSSLVSVLRDLTNLLAEPTARAAYHRLQYRIATLVVETGHIGWGYGDDVADIVLPLQQLWTPPDDAE